MVKYHNNHHSVSATPHGEDSAPPAYDDEYKNETISPSAPPAYDIVELDDEDIEYPHIAREYEQRNPAALPLKPTFTFTKIYNDLPEKPVKQQSVSDAHRQPVSPAVHFSPIIINAGNHYDHSIHNHPRRRTEDEKMSQNSAIWYGFLISLGTLTLAPYGIRAIFKGLRNLLTFDRPLNTLWRLYTVSVGVTIGLIKGAALGAAIGTALPGLGTAAGAMIGLICCPLIGAGIGALAGKYSAKLVSWINARDGVDVSSTNHHKWKMPENAKTNIENHIRDYKPNSLSGNTVFTVMSRLRNQKNAMGKRAYIPLTEDYASRELGNQTLSTIKSGVVPQRHNQYLFWNTHDNETVLALDLKQNHWVEGKVSMQRV